MTVVSISVVMYSRNKTTFDEEVWRSSQHSDDWGSRQNIRLKMLSSLLKRYDLKRLTVQEVEDLLGRPSFIVQDKMYYYLGVKPSMGLDDEVYLILRIEEDKIVGIQHP